MKIAIPDLISNSYFPVIAAVELGCFRDEGLDVELELVVPVENALAALKDGSLEFLGCSSHLVVGGFPEWRGAKLLCAQSQGMYWFMVMRSDLKAAPGDLGALKGRRIGAAYWVGMALKQLLRERGIDPERDGIEISPIPGAHGAGMSFGVMAAQALADRVRDEEADARVRAAMRDLDDGTEARLARLRREQADLAIALEQARARVGVDPSELQSVVGLALAQAGGAWREAATFGDTPVLALDEQAPAFAHDPSWSVMLDELRARPMRGDERARDWRQSRDAAVRRISFAPAILPDGRDAGDVVHLHLEHRLVRRLLGRFISAGFRHGLERACAIRTAATPAPRVVLLGRLALYGEGAARLHEEMVSVAADWRDRSIHDAPLRALAEGRDAEARVLDHLLAALRTAQDADHDIAERATAAAARDVADLRPVLEARAAQRVERVAGEITRRAAAEARGLETLLEARIARIRRERGQDDAQLALLLDPAEARQRAADRRSWARAATRLDDELVREPERLRAAARICATRVEPIGLVYLWPDA